jgi:L-methionine (R)-S-oxide reductase
VSKQDAYAHLLESMKALVEDQRNWVCNTANASSLLWHMFHSLQGPSTAVNWAGFYVVDKRDPSQLILGPFQGKVACQTIKIGSGVCGTVAMNGSSLVLEDVETFPGHIACDGDSKSEVVVPIEVDGKVGGCASSEGLVLTTWQIVGVIDIDCAEVKGFDDDDRRGLEQLANLLAKCCDW